MEDIRILVFFDGSQDANRVNNIMSDLWFQIGEHYPNLEHIFVVDTRENMAVAQKLNVTQVPTVVFLRKVNPNLDEWETVDRATGNVDKGLLQSKLISALEGDQSTGEGKIISGGETESKGLFPWGISANKLSWLVFAILGAFIITRK